jgi:hypothetical protein
MLMGFSRATLAGRPADNGGLARVLGAIEEFAKDTAVFDPGANRRREY